jgi:hypothetical protein
VVKQRKRAWKLDRGDVAVVVNSRRCARRLKESSGRRLFSRGHRIRSTVLGERLAAGGLAFFGPSCRTAGGVNSCSLAAFSPTFVCIDLSVELALYVALLARKTGRTFCAIAAGGAVFLRGDQVSSPSETS